MDLEEQSVDGKFADTTTAAAGPVRHAAGNMDYRRERLKKGGDEGGEMDKNAEAGRDNGPVSARTLFASTAFYEGSVTTDSDGHAKLDVKHLDVAATGKCGKVILSWSDEVVPDAA